MLRIETSGKEPEKQKIKQEKQDNLRNIEKKDKKEMNRHRETRAETVTCVMRSPEAGRRAGQKKCI